MTPLHTAYRRVLGTLRPAVTQLRRTSRREQGDVPGWVLITVMTAGLVSALWLVAGPALTTMFQDALSSVTGR